MLSSSKVVLAHMASRRAQRCRGCWCHCYASHRRAVKRAPGGGGAA